MPLPQEPTSEALMERHPEAKSPDHARELERVKTVTETEEDPREAQRRERRAAFEAHPHTQLKGIMDSLRTPAAQSADINTKFAMLHAGVMRLAQVILGHTPPPEPLEDDNGEERQREHAEGAHEQES